MTVSQTGVAPCSWNKSAFPYKKKNWKSWNIRKVVEEETRCLFHKVIKFYREVNIFARNYLFFKLRRGKIREREAETSFEKSSRNQTIRIRISGYKTEFQFRSTDRYVISRKNRFTCLLMRIWKWLLKLAEFDKKKKITRFLFQHSVLILFPGLIINAKISRSNWEFTTLV